ncbi:hypothetical protein [Nocardioides sp.]|uniref:hypothetical protein n=1 Tax=Nocardioides sp. TaxID=35761 RepID=UPI0037831914
MLADAGAAGGSSPFTASLIVSIIALTVSAAVAGWNVLKYVLDGGRVRVRLERGYLDDVALFSTPYRLSKNGPSKGLRVPSPKHLEVGVVRVENLGRTAVTVFDPSFDLGGRWNWKRMRFGRWTVAPIALKFKDSELESTVRIDPFDFRTFILDAEPAIQSEGPHGAGKPKRLRASVGVAGKRFRRRSSWWQGWPVPAGARALGDPPSVEVVTYREIVRWQNRREPTEGRFVAGYAASRIRESWDNDEVLDLDRIIERLQAAWISPAGDEPETGPAISISLALVQHKFIDLGGKKITAPTGA